MRNPVDCKDINEVRALIDDIDSAIIELLSQRQKCVEEIVRFKKTADEIVAKNRQQELFSQRRAWAEQKGLSPEVVENFYRMLIEHNIQKEMALFKNEKP